VRTLRYSSVVTLALVTAACPAWAAGTVGTARSGKLVLVFLGFCALLIVSQMVPALIVLLESISGFARRMSARKQVAIVKVNGEKPL
jgi:hypothetical protein